MENIINDRNNKKLIKALMVVGTVMWALPLSSTTAYAEECLLDDGFLPGFADGFDTTGGASAAGGGAATACGANASAGGAQSSAFGASANAAGLSSTAIGRNSDANGTGATAIGQDAVASGLNSIATGNGAQATGTNAIAIGNGAIATGSVAIGAAAMAGNGGTAVGDGTSAQGTNSAALGWQSMASAESATALGASAVAAHANSTALGAGAATTRANQVVLGATSSTITAPGITSAASLAAQGAVVGLVTTDSDGNLASDGGALQNQVNTNSADILSLKNMTANLSRDIEENTEGVAMAFALKSAYVPQDKTFALTGGIGFFQDKAAFASSVGFRLNPNLQLDAGLSVGFDSGNVGGRVGATFTW